ncbi:hypothetical protein IF650_12560 [Cellulosimicrobium terreum]|nr:hypothetical protein [Cellulosimicrobium terreum]
MRATSLVVRRARAQGGLLVTILLLAAAIVATIGSTVGYVQSAATSGAREALSAASPTAAAIQVSTRLHPDPQAQDDRVRAVVAEQLPGVPLEVYRSVRTEPLDVSGGPDVASGRAVLEVDPQIGSVAALVSGTWPARSGETSVQEDAAEALGVAVGDTLVVGGSGETEAEPADTSTGADAGTELTVVGTWRPDDPSDPRWFDDPLALSGADGSTVGPLVVDGGTLDTIDTAPFAVWTVVPDADRLDPAHLAVLADGAPSLRDALRSDDAVAVRGLSVAGELGATALATRSAQRAAAAVTLVPVGLLVVVSLVALAQVARLLAQTRAPETGLLVARGATNAQVTAGSGSEATAVVGVGAVLGAVVAQAALGLTGAGTGVGPLPWLVALASTVVGVAVVTTVAWLQVRVVARRGQVDRSGRVRSAAALGTLVIVLAAAALCVWQLRRYGSPLVTTGGSTQVDPLAVLAPALALTALALAATAVLGPLGAGVERLASRGPGLVPVLAARQVARRVVVVAVPVVLVVLASGAATLAGAYAGTTTSTRAAVAELRTGADVRVATGGPASVSETANPPVVARYAALDGATGATSVLRSSAVLGEDPVALLALDAGGAQDVLSLPAGTVTAEDLTGGLVDSDALTGLDLPDDATGLSLDVTASVSLEGEVTPDMPFFWGDSLDARELHAAAWVADASGALSRVALGSVSVGYGEGVGADVGPDPSTHRLAGELPGPGTWRLVGVDLELGTPVAPARAVVEVDAARAISPAGDEPLPFAQGWGPLTSLVREGLAELEPYGQAGVDARLATGGLPLDVRLVPDATADPRVVPVTLPTSLADAYDLAPGDDSEVTVSGVDVPVRVASVADVIPGVVDQTAVLVDQATLQEHLLRVLLTVPRPGAVWIGTSTDATDGTGGTGGTDGPDAAVRADVAVQAAAVAADEGASDVVVEVAGDDAGPDASAPVRVAFWLAAAGAVVLALAGVLAVALALLRTRRAEVMVLRALGTPAGEQARGRATELAAVGLTALVLGMAAGWAVALLTVPELTRATLGAASDVLPVPLASAVGPTLLLLGMLVVGLAAVVGVVAARVRAQGLDAEYREEIR